MIVCGLAVRFAPLGLAPSIVKYGGSTLWAFMLYLIVSSLLPSWHFPTFVLLTGFIATAVEFLKLLHSPRLDAFRHTLPGILLLGRFFSLWNIAAYWAAIIAGALLDSVIRANRFSANDPIL